MILTKMFAVLTVGCALTSGYLFMKGKGDHLSIINAIPFLFIAAIAALIASLCATAGI